MKYTFINFLMAANITYNYFCKLLMQIMDIKSLQKFIINNLF